MAVILPDSNRKSDRAVECPETAVREHIAKPSRRRERENLSNGAEKQKCLLLLRNRQGEGKTLCSLGPDGDAISDV